MSTTLDIPFIQHNTAGVRADVNDVAFHPV